MRPGPLLILAAILIAALLLLLTQLRGPDGGGLDGQPARAQPPHGAPAEALEPAPRDGGGARSLAGPNDEVAAPAEPEAAAAPPPNELRGLVLDAEGRGVEACEVRLLPEPSDPFGARDGAAPAPRSTTTGADGRFAFAGVPPGERHELFLRHPSYALQLVPGVVVGERGSFEEPPIVLRSGKRLHGSVRDELGAPIAGATLELVSEGTPPGAEAFDRLSATTDLEGSYLFTGIADGMRVLSARAPGFGAQTLARAIQFEDRIGQAHRRDFTLRPAASISGRVVASGDGRPIADARLFAQDRRDYMVHASAEARSDASGAFTIEGLQPGLYTVTATAPGYRRGTAREVSPPTEGLELALEPTPTAYGRVVDAASGRPVERFAVRLRSEGLPGMASAPLGAPLEVADASGEFALPDLFEGRLQVEVDAPGYAPAFSASFACDGERDVRGLVVELRAGGALRGVVLDLDGAPVRNATVSCRDEAFVDDALSAAMGDELPTLATRRSARTGADGGFRLAHLFPHEYQLRVSAPGFAPIALRGVELAEGEERTLEPLVLAAASALRGRLFDAELRGVAGGRVFLRALDGPTAPALVVRKSGADGAFRFDDIAPGVYELAGAPPLPSADFARDPLALLAGAEPGRRIEVAPGSEAQADVQLEGYTAPPPVAEPPPTGALNGQVTGGSAESASIELVPLAGGAALTTKSERGQYTFPRVPPGDYLLRVAGRESPTHEVTILVDRFTRQDLRLE